MKVGTVVLVLILALVVLGFVVSDDFQVRKQLITSQEQISQMKTAQAQLIAQLDKAGQDILALEANNADLKNQLATACNVQANGTGPTNSQVTVDKTTLSAVILLLPTLAVGAPALIERFRRRRHYIRLTDPEIEQIIRQRRGQRATR